MTPDIESLARLANIETDLMRMGSGSLVYSNDCEGIPLDDFLLFARLVRDQALEEAAQVCDDNYAVGYTSHGCAKLIRALKGKP